MLANIALCLLICAIYGPRINDADIITEPRPGEEYVFVSSGRQTPLKDFESFHEIREIHPNYRVSKSSDAGAEKLTRKLYSGKANHRTEGALQLDKKAISKNGHNGKVSDSIQVDFPIFKLEDIKIKENVKDDATNTKMAVALETMSEIGKLFNKASTTTQKPVLTTAEPISAREFDYIPINFDTIDDINTGLLSSNVKLEAARSDQKQHSRIQIKRGPNGQDYEYEYIYYYYDEEDGKKEGKEKGWSTTSIPVHNSHDGPQKSDSSNQIVKDKKLKSKYSTIDRLGSTTTAGALEIKTEALTISNRSRQRGRTTAPAPVEEDIEEDGLPSSTRFPPRGRALVSSSPVPEAAEITRPQPDSITDKSIDQTRSRTRAHIRRPSSELVDLDSFKTHSGDIPTRYRESPTRYFSDIKSTTKLPEASSAAKEVAQVTESGSEGHSLVEAIPFQKNIDYSKPPPDYKQTTSFAEETTEFTTMTGMEKIALDLYAYLTGENLNNEINSSMDFDGTTTDNAWTTEGASTTEEATTTRTTTTTTTETTLAPTITSTAASSTLPLRFKERPGPHARISSTTAAPIEQPRDTSTKVRGRFSKTNGVGSRKTSTAAATVASTHSSTGDKITTQPKGFGRRGLFAGITRSPSITTTAPDSSSAVVSDMPAKRPRLRGLGARKPITTPTTAASVGSTAASSAGDAATETTPSAGRAVGRGRPVLRPGAGVASLRPGAHLNIRPNLRLHPGQAASVAYSEAPVEPSAPDSAAQSETEDEMSSQTTVPEQARGGLRPRYRLPAAAPSPRPRAPVSQLPRRPNPLLKRKLTTAEATTEAAKKSTEVAEESTSEEKSETESEAPAEMIPPPPLRGLDALLARRRAAGGIGGIAAPARHTRSVNSK